MCVHACLCERVCMRVCVCVHACVCERVCMRVCECMVVHMCMFAQIGTA